MWAVSITDIWWSTAFATAVTDTDFITVTDVLHACHIGTGADEQLSSMLLLTHIIRAVTLKCKYLKCNCKQLAKTDRLSWLIKLTSIKTECQNICFSVASISGFLFNVSRVCISIARLLRLFRCLNDKMTNLCSASSVNWQRGTARICCCSPCWGMAAADHWPCSNWLISPGCWALSSKPSAVACGDKCWDKQTDKQWAPDGCKHPALHTMHCMQCQKLFRIFLLPLTYQMQLLSNAVCLPSVLWRHWLGGRKGTRPVKNWVVWCWRGYLSEARCRLAYGPADATATHCLLLQ